MISRFIKWVLFSFFLFLFFIPGVTDAMTVTLGWNANTEENLAGYKIYYRQDGSGDRIDGNYDGVGAHEGDSPIVMYLDEDQDPDPRFVEYSVHWLDRTRVYYFVVTAFSVCGLESACSNEVHTTLPEPPPYVDPVDDPPDNYVDPIEETSMSRLRGLSRNRIEVPIEEEPIEVYGK